MPKIVGHSQVMLSKGQCFRQARNPRAERFVVELGHGRTLTVCGVESTLDGMINFLTELLAKSRKAKQLGLRLPSFLMMLSDQAQAGSPPAK